MALRPAPLALALTAALLAACGDGSPAAPADLAHGARVRFTAEGWRSWTTGVVGSVGPCLAVMVPDAWDRPQRFDVVRVEALTALRVSDRFDGLPGEDGAARVFSIPGDTAGEGWTEMALDSVRARHGGCDPAG